MYKPENQKPNINTKFVKLQIIIYLPILYHVYIYNDIRIIQYDDIL